MNSSDRYILAKAAESDVEVKKSHFLCELKLVKSEDEAKAFIDSVRKKHYDARHHCFAMRIGSPEAVFERSGDDGEPQGTAGKPMLEILKGAALYDVCAVVTRYFGGTLLGTGGLVRAYSDSLKEALTKSEMAELKSGLKIKVCCGYSEAEKIKRQAYNMNIKSIGEEYTENCIISFLVPEGDKDVFLNKVSQLSLGKAAAETVSRLQYITAPSSGSIQIYLEEK